MPYEILPEAKQDMREEASRAYEMGGKEALEEHRSGLERAFAEIGESTSPSIVVGKTIPDLLLMKYRSHYIFSIARGRKEGRALYVIIGVFHETKDIVACLPRRNHVLIPG